MLARGTKICFNRSTCTGLIPHYEIQPLLFGLRPWTDWIGIRNFFRSFVTARPCRIQFVQSAILHHHGVLEVFFCLYVVTPPTKVILRIAKLAFPCDSLAWNGDTATSQQPGLTIITMYADINRREHSAGWL